MDRERAEFQLRQFAHTFRRDGSLHGPGSRRLYHGQIPRTITLGGTVRVTRMCLQSALATAVVSPDWPIELPPSAEPIRPLIYKALEETKDTKPRGQGGDRG